MPNLCGLGRKVDGGVPHLIPRILLGCEISFLIQSFGHLSIRLLGFLFVAFVIKR